MQLIEHLKWRYATKKFDTSKKVSTSNLERIQEAIQLTPTSYGLQLYKVIIVENEGLKAKLKDASWGQQQVQQASHLFVFCRPLEIKEDVIYDYLKLKAKTQDLNYNNLMGYGDFIKGSVFGKSAEERKAWTAKQAYLALGNLMLAAAELKIDVCPIEGFAPEKFDQLLQLTEKGLTAVVIAAIGYRSDEDQTQFATKVRKPIGELFETVS